MFSQYVAQWIDTISKHLIMIIAHNDCIERCRKLSPTHMFKCPGHDRVQVTCNTFSAYHVQHNHVQHIQCLSRAISFCMV